MSLSPTLLLIGAGGFVGGHVDEAARAAGLRVLRAGRDTDDGLPCDLPDPASVEACVREAAPDLVVNMAGAASVAASWERPAQTFAVNTTGVVNLLQAVTLHAPEAHVLCVSSAEVYGEPSAEKLPFAEDLPLEPLTPYGASKAAMEIACGQYARTRNLRIAVVRAFNQLGPRQSPAFAASGFARQVAAAELGGEEGIELAVGNLEAARDFTDVRDTARAFVEISSRGLTGTYNLCSGRLTRLEELVALLAGATDLPLSVRSDPALKRPVDPAAAYGSPERLREAIGFVPQIPLSQTVGDLLGWWRAKLAAA